MSSRFPQPCLMLVTEPGPELTNIVIQAVEGGVNVVQWREKGTNLGAGPLASSMRASVLKSSLLLVNGDGSLWASCDGVHLPEFDPIPWTGRTANVRQPLFGRSVHSLDSALKAAVEGADYVVAGTIFASKSHPEIEPQGLDFLRSITAALTIPVIAIGGVTPNKVSSCIDAGAAGVAVLSPIMRAEDPRKAAQTYRDALDEAWKEAR